MLSRFLFLLGLSSVVLHSQSADAVTKSELDLNHGLIPYETLSLKSQSNHKEYDLFIQLPESYPDAKIKYPLIIVNDCRWGFPIVSGAVTLMATNVIREAITACISYSKGDDRRLSRTRDYTPTYSPVEANGHSSDARKASGHAKEYTAFIGDQVLPLLKNKYPVDNEQTIFIGHSFGGLLGSYMLFARPTLFNHYIIGSPSLWYDDRTIFTMEKNYASNNKDLKAHAMIFVDDNDGKPSSLAMDTNVLALAELLKSRHYPNLTLDTRVITGANHHSVFATIVAQGLMASIPLKP